MDTLTHALSGALLARATAPRDAPPRSIPRRIAAGFFACAFPDIDFVLGFAGPVEYLLYHRGATHSLLLLPLWAIVVAWLLAKVLREPRGWRALYGVCALGIGAHVAGDLVTSFGTMILAPVSNARFGWGTTFIIDVWFTGIIVAGLAASAVRYRSRLPSVAACAVLVAYVLFQGWAKSEALDFALRHAASLGRANAEIAAYPRAVSPFNWTVYVSDEDVHRYAHVNLVRTQARIPAPGDGFVARLDAPFLPLAEARWETRARFGSAREESEIARSAWESGVLDFFRWFAEKPAYDGRSEGSTCVWFIDLRFVNPGRDWVPFRFGACRDSPAAPWRAYERLDTGGSSPLRSPG
ncbi:MAG: metal-dependent hydrolase [Burkholderiales bacterium]